jgi:uncharacterized protein with NAD-binding domain and iron-sulfur cluster
VARARAVETANRLRAPDLEEHGFHVWMGFYDNAFKMMKDTYGELARKKGPISGLDGCLQET